MRDIKKLKSWSDAFAKEYGEIAAQQFAVGLDDYNGYIIEDICQLRAMRKSATVADLPYSLLSIHLPARFLKKCTRPFLNKLSRCALAMRDRFKNGEFTATCVADEVILHGIATCSIVHFEMQADEDQTEFSEEYQDVSWIYEIAGDEEIEMLFDEEDPIELDPEDDYYYFPENWFKDYYEPIPDEDLMKFIEAHEKPSDN